MQRLAVGAVVSVLLTAEPQTPLTTLMPEELPEPEDDVLPEPEELLELAVVVPAPEELPEPEDEVLPKLEEEPLVHEPPVAGGERLVLAGIVNPGGPQLPAIAGKFTGALNTGLLAAIE